MRDRQWRALPVENRSGEFVAKRMQKASMYTPQSTELACRGESVRIVWFQFGVGLSVTLPHALLRTSLKMLRRKWYSV